MCSRAIVILHIQEEYVAKVPLNDQEIPAGSSHSAVPYEDLDFHRQNKRKPARCHRITVSGLTIRKAFTTLGVII